MIAPLADQRRRLGETLLNRYGFFKERETLIVSVFWFWAPTI